MSSRVRDAVLDADEPALVMDFVAGRSVAELAADGHAFDEAEALARGRGRRRRAGDGPRGRIVHRDLKPANVLIGDDGVVRLSDFGIAVGLEDATALTAEDGVIGTLRYLAPERLAGSPATPATDVWGLGTVLYEMLTGVAAFPETTLAARVEAAAAPVTRPDGLTDATWAVLARALASDPADRYPDGAAMATALHRLPGVPAAAVVPPDPSAPTEVIALPVAASLAAAAALAIDRRRHAAATGALPAIEPPPPWARVRDRPRHRRRLRDAVDHAEEALAQRPGAWPGSSACSRWRSWSGWPPAAPPPGTRSGSSGASDSPPPSATPSPPAEEADEAPPRRRSRARTTTRARARATATATTTETTEPRYPADRRRGQQDEVMGAGRSGMAGVGARIAVRFRSSWPAAGHGAPSTSVPTTASATPAATSPGTDERGFAVAIPSVEPTPSATPGSAGLGTDRINVLLLGVDRGPGREDQASTDVMMVASIDPVGKTASFLSIPRDLVDVPLADGSPYRQKLNSMVREVGLNPGRFPGGDQGGEMVLAGALSRFLGIEIPYWASIDFTGFKALVSAVDGIDVYAWRPICDGTYRDDRFDGFGVGVGRWRMDDDEALAWVRVRKPPPESDFTRTIRQVQVLIGLRERIVESGLMADPLAALESLGVVRTNVPDEVIEGLATLAPELTNDRIYRRTIQPPELVDETSDARGYILVARDADIEAMVEILFPPPGDRPTTGKVTRYVSDEPAKELQRASC